jgi:hypothetical protein
MMSSANFYVGHRVVVEAEASVVYGRHAASAEVAR